MVLFFGLCLLWGGVWGGVCFVYGLLLDDVVNSVAKVL